MDATEFRKRAKEMVDYVADYLENIKERRPLSDVEPGYLHKQMPTEAPQDAETWEDLFPDIEKLIMPGVSFLWLVRKVFKTPQKFLIGLLKQKGLMVETSNIVFTEI